MDVKQTFWPIRMIRNACLQVGSLLGIDMDYVHTLSTYLLSRKLRTRALSQFRRAGTQDREMPRPKLDSVEDYTNASTMYKYERRHTRTLEPKRGPLNQVHISISAYLYHVQVGQFIITLHKSHNAW